MIPRPLQELGGDSEKMTPCIHTIAYFDWVANIVPVPKKDGNVRMCVDYRDLNWASPKDNFSLPHIDTLIDNTDQHALLPYGWILRS